MPNETGAPTTRTEAVVVFDDAEKMQTAIDELLNHGSGQDVHLHETPDPQAA